jgi:DNA transposition AAA+ family ATPase
LKEYGVKLLILDDAHYLKLKALRELVQIHELLKIPVILSGTRELREQLKSEWKQVHNSFLSLYRFPALTIDQTASIVNTWLNDFLGWEEESDLLYEDVLKKLHEKTGGLTGPLNDTLQKIAIQALKKGLGRLDEKIIHEVLDGQVSAVTSKEP